jgi:hypothetical protein
MQAGAKIVPLTSIAPKAQQVIVGIYPTTIYDLNVEGSTYSMATYVWFRWKGAEDPTATIEFTNAIEGTTKTKLLDAPTVMPDGSKYMIMTVSGRFFQSFDLLDYPLDRQNITLSIEDATHGVNERVFVPDMPDSGFGAMLKIPGWQILGWRVTKVMQDYGGRFGDLSANGASRYAGLQFELIIERSFDFFIWKLLLPLFIVLCANWMVLLLEPELVDVRTALPATALLTLVFLQKSYSDGLPSVGSLVLMDDIYAVAYLVVVVTLVQVIISAAWLQNRITPERTLLVERLDHISLLGQISLFALSTVIFVLLTQRF